MNMIPRSDARKGSGCGIFYGAKENDKIFFNLIKEKGRNGNI
jgi:hypothetical protein